MKKCFLFLTTIALILSLSTNAFAKNTSGDLSQKQALQWRYQQESIFGTQ